MRAINKLTAQQVKGFRDPGRYSDGGGLYLYVDPAGGRRWVFRYKRHGKARELGLGPAWDVSLAEARAGAEQSRKAIREGHEPKATKRGRAPSFGEIADRYIETMTPSWKNEKHAAQWTATLKTHAKRLRSMPVDAIAAADVVAVLRPIWSRIPETAQRVRGRIEAILDAAKAEGHRTGENPATWKGNLKHLLPAPQKLTRGHFAAVPYPELPQLVARLRGLDSVSALAIEWTILTAARSGETRGCTRDEIDRDSMVWTVPAERMKTKRVHRVPLVPRCLEILTRMEKVGCPVLFPGIYGQPLSDMALTQCLRGFRPGFTVHGFRSSFRDWAGDCTTHPRELIEAALAHIVGDKAEQAYRRGDALERRRALMNEWGRYCEPSPVGAVVRLRG